MGVDVPGTEELYRTVRPGVWREEKGKRCSPGCEKVFQFR